MNATPFEGLSAVTTAWRPQWRDALGAYLEEVHQRTGSERTPVEYARLLARFLDGVAAPEAGGPLRSTPSPTVPGHPGERRRHRRSGSDSRRWQGSMTSPGAWDWSTATQLRRSSDRASDSPYRVDSALAS